MKKKHAEKDGHVKHDRDKWGTDACPLLEGNVRERSTERGRRDDGRTDGQRGNRRRRVRKAGGERSKRRDR